MFIFNKKAAAIFNTEQIVKIYSYEYRPCQILYDDVNGGGYMVAEYETPEKAREVVRKIFDAMKNGEKTFELP